MGALRGAVLLPPLPPGAPVLSCSVSAHTLYECAPPSPDRWLLYEPASQVRPVDAAAQLLDALESLARGLFPAWAGSDGTHFSAGRSVVAAAARALGRAEAQRVGGFAPFWEAAAERASVDRPLRGGFSLEVEAEQLALLTRNAYRASRLVLLVALPESPATDATLVGTLEWFAGLSGSAVIVCGAEGRAVLSRYPYWDSGLASSRAGAGRAAETESGLVAPPVAGLPHPLSRAERALARRLDRASWAAGRVHNASLRLGAFAKEARVDVLWPTERVAVEIDGPEHLREPRFSEDRRRDVDLQLMGYLVVRCTNDEVEHDLDAVMAQIERCVRARHNAGGSHGD